MDLVDDTVGSAVNAEYDLLNRALPGMVTNMTLFTMLLLSLNKDKPFPKTSQTFKSSYDYIIVGAGAAGCVMANRFTQKKCVKVLLLEAGGDAKLLSEIPSTPRILYNSSIDWHYMTTPQKYCAKGHNENRVVWNSGKGLGGGSILNSMLYVRGNRKNYDEWEKEGCTGWGYKDVLTYFKKFEDNQNLGDPEIDCEYHGGGKNLTVEKPKYEPRCKKAILEATAALGYEITDINGNRQTGIYDMQATTRNGQRCSAAKAYLVPVENRPNLTILKRAYVTKILMLGKLAYGVEFDFNGTSNTVHARKEVIVSAGTVRTAQLLMLAGIGPKEHLEKFNVSPMASPSQVTLMAFLNGLNTTSKSPDFPRQELYFAEYATIDALLNYNLKPEYYASYFGPYTVYPSGMYTCLTSLLQPYSRGEILLNSADPHDLPLINPNYYQDIRDLEDVIEGMKICQAVGTHPALKAIGAEPFKTTYPGCKQYEGDEDKYYGCMARSVTTSFWHPVGTARMGQPDDPRSVVDPKLRVIGVKNLRVINAAVMPIIPSGNTNAPTMMVAEKAYDMMKDDMKCCKRKIIRKCKGHH